MDATEVFDPSDFESIQLKISFHNLTTRTEIKSTETISLVEFGDKTVVLELPAKSCNAKHNIMFKVEKLDRKAKKSQEIFSATGKVLEIDHPSEDQCRAKIDLLQYEEQNWNNLLNLYSRRQEAITRFLASVKG